MTHFIKRFSKDSPEKILVEIRDRSEARRLEILRRAADMYIRSAAGVGLSACDLKRERGTSSHVECIRQSAFRIDPRALVQAQ